MEDIDIARTAKLKNINEITNDLQIPEEYVEQYGKYKAKISLDYYNKIKDNKNAKLILVTSINPTPMGEGKTTSSIGLVDGLNKIGKKAIIALREPSLGPVFGVKGGATGGGYSQVAPMEDINLHFTGDIHAITSANNLLSALIDNHIFQGNELRIKKITWKRCLDLNDRALRKIQIGLSGEKRAIPREDGFDISVASEIMAILCLATDIKDLKRRIGNIIIGYNEENEPITCRDIKADGSLTVLLKDAINPNIVQTLENNPAFIHGGPFANIAHGCNSIVATKMAMKLADYVVTEAGFGADLGAEKFLNIKCRKLGVTPDAVVIVATIRAVKYHGISNILKHVNNIKNFGLNTIVAINRFSTDTDDEIDELKKELQDLTEVRVMDNWLNGGNGATEIANKVIALTEKQNTFNYTYSIEDSITEKIEKVAQNIYGAKNVEYSPEAIEQIKNIEKLDLKVGQLKGIESVSKLPICIAKTQYSLSDDPNNLNCDVPFVIHVTSVEVRTGAEFIVVKTGKIMTMPGLPKEPAAEKIDLDDNNNIVGIF